MLVFKFLHSIVFFRESKLEQAFFFFSLKSKQKGFPGGSVAKNLPSKAGDTSLICGLGRSHKQQSSQAHAPQLMSLRSRAQELHLLKPVCPEPMFTNKRSHYSEKPAHLNERAASAPTTREKPAQQGRPNTAKNRLIK